MMTLKSKILAILFTLLGLGFVIPEVKDVPAGAFNAVRSFTAPQISNTNVVSYEFGVVDIPLERAGAASSSTGFEFGKLMVTGTTAFTVASTSTGFAFTVNESGK